MTEVSTRERAGAYDALETAKEGEPIFVMQGGDALSPPTILHYAGMLRRDAMSEPDRATAEAHYGEHADKPFFADLVDFITGGPLVAAVIEGPDAIVQWRNMMGATNPVNAAQGTIRGDLATEMQNNVTHGSDSPESAAREVALFFPGLA